MRCLKHDALRRLLDLTYDAHVKTITNSCWALNNFVLSGFEHASAFVSEGGYDRVLSLCNHLNVDIRSEALFSMCSCIEQVSQQRDQPMSSVKMTPFELLLSKSETQQFLIKRLVDGLRILKPTLLKEILNALSILI